MPTSTITHYLPSNLCTADKLLFFNWASLSSYRLVCLRKNRTSTELYLRYQAINILKMESRYTSRFRGIPAISADHLKKQDLAGSLTENYTTAKASLQTQRENARLLYSTSVEMIKGIDTFQSVAGIELVQNIPLLPEERSTEPSNQLGYTRVALRFLQSGCLHFMEETISAHHRIQELEKFISRLSEYNTPADLVGQIADLDIDTIDTSVQTPDVKKGENAKPASPVDSVTSPTSVSASKAKTTKPASKK